MSLDFVVIGAGISGLSAAWSLQQLGKTGIILEAETKAGGCIDSIVFDNCHQELGAHSAFNSYQGLITIWKSLEDRPEILPKKKTKFMIFENGAISSVFSKINPWLAIVSMLNLPFLEKNKNTVKEYYGSILGGKNYDNIIRHALSAVSSQEVDNMPADFLFRKRHKDKNFARKYSFKNGMSEFIYKLAHTLDIKTGTAVTTIKKSELGWQMHTNSDTYYAQKIILATPPVQAAQLISDSEPELGQALSAIKPTETETCSVLLKGDMAHIKPCSGWIGIKEKFYSMISADPVNSANNYRGFSFHFKSKVLKRPEREQYALDCLRTQQSQVLYFKHKKNILPKIEHDHFAKVTNIKSALGKDIAVTGNYFNGMAIEDCIQRSFYEVDRISTT